jgi:hypothetical protein
MVLLRTVPDTATTASVMYVKTSSKENLASKSWAPRTFQSAPAHNDPARYVEKLLQ